MSDDPKEKLLVLAKNSKNLELLCNFLEDEGYHPFGASTLSSFDEKLEERDSFALALVDVSGFGKEVWDRCERLRELGTPFFTIFPKQNKKSKEVTGRTDRILTKPLSKGRLTELVKVMLGSRDR